MTSSERYKLNRQNPEWLVKEKERDRARWRAKHPSKPPDQLIDGETWMPIKDHHGYFVSDFGRIKNSKGHIRKLQKMTSGYYYVPIGSKHISVHRCVLMAFNPHLNQCSLHVNHKDFNRLNNNISNLEWVTRSGNVQHAINGGRFEEAFHKSSLLSRSQIKEALDRHLSGIRIIDIANEYGIRYKAMHKILTKAKCRQQKKSSVS